MSLSEKSLEEEEDPGGIHKSSLSVGVFIYSFRIVSYRIAWRALHHHRHRHRRHRHHQESSCALLILILVLVLIFSMIHRGGDVHHHHSHSIWCLLSTQHHASSLQLARRMTTASRRVYQDTTPYSREEETCLKAQAQGLVQARVG